MFSSLSLEKNCQHAYIAKAWLEVLVGDDKAAAESIKHCYSINPNSSFFVSACSLGWGMLGEYDLSLKILEKAMHQNPLPYWWMSLPKFFLALKKNNYQEALFHAEKKGTPKVIYEYILEMIACHYLGDVNSLKKYVALYQEKSTGNIDFVSRSLPTIIFDPEVKLLVIRALESINTTYISKEIKTTGSTFD